MHKIIWTILLLATLGGGALAKLPPLSDEAKAKAAEAGAKTAWTAKVDAYLLCKAQDRVAARVAKGAGSKDTKVATSACADPGPFVYPVPDAAAAPASAGVAAAKGASAPMPAKPAAAKKS